MNLSKNILNAVSGVTKSLPSAFIKSTVYDKGTKAYNSKTAVNVYEERSVDVVSMFEKFKEDEIDGKIVKNYDVKLMVLPSNSNGFPFKFSSVDRILVSEQNFSVVATFPIYVGPEIVAYTFHARPQGYS